MTIAIRQSSELNGTNWWNWAVWLEGSKKEMDAIDHVVYTLHATFPDPVKTIKKRSNGFRLESAGWGEFEIFIEIVRKNKHTLKRKHWLSLSEESPPRKTIATSGGTATLRSAKALKSSESARSESRTRSVYVSSSLADAPFAETLRQGFASRGVKVRSFDDIAAGDHWESAVKQAIKDSDAAVFVVSGQPSSWSKLEMEYANGVQTKSIPVLVGNNARLPTKLQSERVVHVDSSKEADLALERILDVANLKA